MDVCVCVWGGGGGGVDDDIITLHDYTYVTFCFFFHFLQTGRGFRGRR